MMKSNNRHEGLESITQPLMEKSTDQLIINAELIGEDELRIFIESNLPIDSKVLTSIDVSRKHEMIVDGKVTLDHEGEPMLYGGTYFSKRASLSEWRTSPSTISIADDVWNDFVKAEQDRTAKSGWYWEVGTISDYIDISGCYWSWRLFEKYKTECNRGKGNTN